jgi:Carboxypeptidase regulatory-like domain
MTLDLVEALPLPRQTDKRRAISRLKPNGLRAAFILSFLFWLVPLGLAQDSAAISGTITDPSGAVVAGANVTAKNTDTGIGRATVTDTAGRYQLLTLRVGNYEVHVKQSGFPEAIRTGIYLVIGQEAEVDIALRLGEASTAITINEDAPIVSVTNADISGLVGEQQVKELPLNGRSYDELLTLNPGVVNFTWEKTGGLVGISNSTTANMFSVSGNRPQQNLFLLNGIEYTGAAENNMTPGGASGQLLGIDAVREFNLLRDSYGAEYGKKPGGQVSIVTQSGTNQWHGSVYEFLRNNALDARNFFDEGSSAPPFKRNEFGVSLGGPIQKDKTFFFFDYEGFRQALDETSVALVPDAQSRADAVPIVRQLGLMNLWPAAPANAPDIKITGADGIQQYFSSPLQTIREDFGTARLDHTFSERDNASAVYTVDDSFSNTATVFDPFSTDLVSLREQVFSLEEAHSFSSSFVNTARFGFSRAGYFFTGEPTPGTPAASVSGFLAGLPVGAVVVGGSQASNPQTQIGLAGSNNGSNLDIARNLFTYTDQVSVVHGRQQWTAGIWLQRFQSNENMVLSQYGQMTFAGLGALVNGEASFLYSPTPTPLEWRSLFGAFFAEDVIRLSPLLTLSLGFRGESSTGWNEVDGRAANYQLLNGGAAQCQLMTGPCFPAVGSSFLSVNRAKFLPEPRLGFAWSPFGKTTVIRAGFGMYNDLQDALGYRADQNAPFNPTYTVAACATVGCISNLKLPISPTAATFAGTLVPGGVQPDMYTPTVVTWSLRLEQELSPNTSLSVGYVGNHGYHELIGVDENAPQPVVCPAVPCPANFPATAAYGVLAGFPVPAGTFYIAPTATGAPPPKPNPALANTWTWMSEGDSSYNALQVDLDRRFSKGLSLRGVYTFSKVLDDGDSYNATAAGNAPGLVANPYDVRADWGLGTFDVRNLGVITATYDLPLGHGRQWLGSTNGVEGVLVSGWTVNSVVTLQSGFPFTPQLSYNPSNDGDTRNPVRPFVNPNFSGPVIVGTPGEWFNPAAFAAVPNNSGFFGNLGRDTLIGPGVATWDFSAMKDTRIRERMTVQFRAEIFNILNRANFNTPSLIVAVLEPGSTAPTSSGIGGLITGTSTSSRQVQFGLKLLW